MPLRTRSSLVGERPISGNVTTLINGVPSHPANAFTNFFLPKKVSLMKDVVGQRGQNNPVNQVTIDFLTGSFPPVTNPANGAVITVIPNDTVFIPSLDGSCPDFVGWPWFAPFSAAVLSSWSLEAFTKFQEQVPTTISLANSLYELKDIKGLIPKISPSKLKEFSSGNFLAYEFGVLPMISDIKAVVALSDVVDKRLKHLIAMNGKSSHLSFDRDESYTDPFAFFVSNNDPAQNNLSDYSISDDSGQGIVFRRLSAKQHFHIGGSLFQDLEDLKSSTAKLKGLIAAGGFNHPGRIVWNAIPYSFVVDWFFSIGKLIDTLEVQPYGGTYKVSNVMWSAKSTALYEVIVQWGHGFSYNRISVGNVRVKIYERYNGFPAYSVFLTTGMLTPMQMALGAAMIHQRS